MRGFPAHAPMCDQRHLVRFIERVKLPWEPTPLALHIKDHIVEGQAAVSGSEFFTADSTSASEISDSARN